MSDKFNPTGPTVDPIIWKPSAELTGLALRRCSWINCDAVNGIESKEEWLTAIIVGAYYQGIADLVKHKSPKWREQAARVSELEADNARLSNLYAQVDSGLDAARSRIAELERELSAAVARAEKAEAGLKQAREILFAYGEKNDWTAHPWWAVVVKNAMGWRAIAAGPFFSRKRAQDWLDSNRHNYKAAHVWCFSGHASAHYVGLRAALDAPQAPAQGREE